MKKLLTPLLIMVFLLTGILIFMVSFHNGDYKNSKPDVEFLTDKAQLFTADQAAKLTRKLHALSDKSKIQIVLYTTTGSNMDLDDDASAYLEKHGFAQNCVVIAINMDPNNREVLISGYGKAKFLIGNKQAQSITDAMVPDLKNADYVNAVNFAISRIDYYIKHPVNALLPALGLGLLASSILSAIIVFVMVYNSGGVNTTNSRTYLDKKNSKLLAKQDIYTHTTKTKTKISKESGSGSSSSHGSHSTGRSKF